MSYKWCAVPKCSNTSIKTPEKLFICVPQKAKMRQKWLQLSRRNCNDIKPSSKIYFCEDHFNLQEDMANYYQYNMGLSQRIIMKNNVLPSKFSCQPDRNKRISDAGTSRSAFVKRQKMDLIQECENTLQRVPVGYAGAMRMEALGKEEEEPAASVHVSELLQNDNGLLNIMKCESKTESEPVTHYQNDPDHDAHAAPCSVEMCRICFGTDCSESMASSQGLDDAYELLTGIRTADEAHLPRRLCAGCADRLANCARFGRRAARAHAVLRAVYGTHGRITVDLVRSVINDQNLLNHTSASLDDDEEIDNGNNTDGICDVKVEDIGDNDDIKCEIDDVIDEIETGDTSVAGHVKIENDLNDQQLACSNSDGVVGEDCTDNYDAVWSANNLVEAAATSQGVKQEDQDASDLKPAEPPPAAGGCSADGFRCDICPYRTDVDVHLLQHLVSHATTNFKYHCDTCDYKTDRRSRLDRHKPKHNGEKAYSCEICQKSFKFKGSIKTHMLLHTNEKPYSCDVCDKKFKRKDQVDAHSRIHFGTKPYSCHFCDKGFCHKSNLQVHLTTHSGESPYLYPCNICEKSCKSKQQLREHLKFHSGKKYSCHICNKEFVLENYLRRHLLIHNTVKMFSCDICEKSFTTKQLLKNHSKIHSGKKPYSCKVCKKAFILKRGLDRHVITHSDEKLHICDICKKPFRRKDQVIHHISRMHSQKKSKRGGKRKSF